MAEETTESKWMKFEDFNPRLHTWLSLKGSRGPLYIVALILTVELRDPYCGTAREKEEQPAKYVKLAQVESLKSGSSPRAVERVE